MTDNYLGYGSLISPSVVAAYFSDNRADKVNEKYSRKFPEDESVLIDDFVEKWREIKDDVEMIPVKVDGMKRSYSLKTGRGGLMLSASENEDEWINAVVIRGLLEEQQKILDDVESDYIKREIPLKSIKTYPQVEAEITEEPILYLSDRTEKFDPGDREINYLYHRTILEGIQLLAEEYGQDFAKDFKQDFIETTYLRGRSVSDTDI